MSKRGRNVRGKPVVDTNISTEPAAPLRSRSTALTLSISRSGKSVVTSFLQQLVTPSATSESLRRLGVDLGAGDATKSPLDSLSEESLYLAAAAVAIVEAIIRETLQSLAARREEAAADPTHLKEFFSLCTVSFTNEQHEALRDAVAAFVNVIPLRDPLTQLDIETPRVMRRIFDGILAARAFERDRRDFASRLAAFRGDESDLTQHLSPQLQGIGGVISSIGPWPTDNIAHGVVGQCLRLYIGAAYRTGSGILFNTTRRRMLLANVLRRVFEEEGLPPFLRSCRRTTDVQRLSWETPCCTLSTLAFSASELPQASFAIPDHRISDLSRELADISKRYVAFSICCPPRALIVSMLQGSFTTKLEAFELPSMVVADSFDSAPQPNIHAFLRSVKINALTDGSPKGSQTALVVILAEERATPLGPFDDEPAPGMAFCRAQVSADSIVGITEIHVPLE